MAFLCRGFDRLLQSACPNGLVLCCQCVSVCECKVSLSGWETRASLCEHSPPAILILSMGE